MLLMEAVLLGSYLPVVLPHSHSHMYKSKQWDGGKIAGRIVRLQVRETAPGECLP